MENRRSNAYTKKQLLHLAISFCFIFLFGAFCPTWGGITRLGVRAIGIFIGGIWLIANRFGMVIPSFIIMFAGPEASSPGRACSRHEPERDRRADGYHPFRARPF